jgi:hypothetical protein
MALSRAAQKAATARNLLTASIAALALIGGSLLEPAAAAAAPGESPAQALAASAPGEATMKLVGFDEAAAKANGLEIVTLPDGAQAAVPAAKAAAARAGTYRPTKGVLPAKSAGTPGTNYAEAHGDCGTSWVDLTPTGYAWAVLTSGVRLHPEAGSAWDVHWTIEIKDRGGRSAPYFDEYDGFTGTFSWTMYGVDVHLTVGPATAQVTYGSFVITSEAWVCFSYGPKTSATIS